MRFAAIDVETANRRQRSICQLAVVVFENGREIAGEAVLVNPGEEFDPVNVAIHGIEAKDVQGAMMFPQLHARLAGFLGGHYVLSHHTFDRIAIGQASLHHGLGAIECNWVDSCAVAKAVWPHLRDAGGHGLKNLAREFDIPLRHHDALEDARVAGRLLVRAMEESGNDLAHWAKFSAPRSRGSYRGSSVDIAREGDGDGPLLGERVVFTGNFTVDKFELADMAHVAGAAVRKRVTKETSMVVVGELVAGVVGEDGKSSNLRYAEELALNGANILFVTEADFRELVRGPGGVS
jgi:DNA polymerase-3 subunit epsilon